MLFHVEYFDNLNYLEFILEIERDNYGYLQQQ